MDEMRNYFKKVQEFSRKNVERCFGVLRQRWHYVKNPCRAWTLENMRNAIYTYIILHNMILEDDRRAICQHYVPENVQQQQQQPQATIWKRVQNVYRMLSREIHNAFTNDLVQHVVVLADSSRM
ncbi:uncharacterized protein LOC143575816 [Bidens hawaiensis]|uniref:uncharacterized protein LOC143575816 n=1 Tax=Bidens hawaiensis TaxID=980011 RepID=UPI0040497E92